MTINLYSFSINICSPNKIEIIVVIIILFLPMDIRWFYSQESLKPVYTSVQQKRQLPLLLVKPAKYRNCYVL